MTGAVRDVMSKDPVVIQEGDSCQEALARMYRRRVRHLPVLDGHGLVIGVLTDRDLRHHLLSSSVIGNLGQVPVAALLEKVLVSAVMSAPPVVTNPEVSLSDAVKLMRERRLGSLPVVEGRRLVGILTESDLLRRLVAADAVDVEAIVVSYP